MSGFDFANLEILVIDDDSFMLKLIKRILFDLNVSKVNEATDGAEGLRLIKESRKSFDVVICDLEMPIMDGLEFVRLLRSDKTLPNPDVPVLILTGVSTTENVQESVKLGIHGFLAKPVSPDSLAKKIRSAISSPAIDPKIL